MMFIKEIIIIWEHERSTHAQLIIEHLLSQGTVSHYIVNYLITFIIIPNLADLWERDLSFDKVAVSLSF